MCCASNIRGGVSGVRAEDGPIRIMAIRKYGPITLSKKKWHPIWDWSKCEVVDAIAKEGRSSRPNTSG